ncbi:MAG: YggS family pyridoxal phosphate-dependent enzyme [Defluviitaleaceae bacterium]|nr:YggS family pyridoxal phosphate-dependent enzyme [Defluviitaleaceae bacterium]
MNLEKNLQIVNTNIAEACKLSNRNKKEISIIGVTKNVDLETTKNLIEKGIIHLGENRPIPFLEKHEAFKNITNKPIWHFIGNLQTRQVRKVINKIDYLHSLDRLSLAIEIEKYAEKEVKCFIQVNTSLEKTKQGIYPEEILDFIKNISIFKKIKIVGLMTMAPYTEDESILLNCFEKLKICLNKIKELDEYKFVSIGLSMGMSNDYKIAILKGATFIRLGTCLFE